MKAHFLKFKQHAKERPFDVIKGSLLAFFGFILSPLSWWNDLLVNFPLSYLFAYIVTWLLSPFYQFTLSGFLIWLGIGYWITNILGFYLMHKGAQKAIKYEGQTLRDYGIAIIYTLIVIGLVFLGFIEPIVDTVNILPGWVKV